MDTYSPLHTNNHQLAQQCDGYEGTMELRDTFGALRQLSKEVQEILVVHNRELNEAAMWSLGRWWVENTPKRPGISRTLNVSTRRIMSGVLGKACRSTRK